MNQIKKAAVIGSGVMGSGIAAHLANAGIPTLLLDVVPKQLTVEEEKQGLSLEDSKVRNRLAYSAKKKLLKQKPAPLMSKDNIHLIEAGNISDDLDKLQEVDWIVEAVVENLEVKKSIFKKIDEIRNEHSIISSNTSGISIEDMASGRSESFQKHFLGTHFFNPPRYLKLLELIPTQNTSQYILQFMKQFGENILGKGIVIAKDTPNFIANRIGIYSLLITIEEMVNRGLSIGEVDSITGPLIGRPKSATFRMLDVVGLDTLIHVAKNIYEKVEDTEKDIFNVPDFMEKMNQKGWLGSKTGQGFYLKKGKDILELDLGTFEYVSRKKLKTSSVTMSKQAKSLAEKLRMVIYANDTSGKFLWNMMKKTLLYSAEKQQEISEDVPSIDNAMKWGFAWKLGPFEIWDAIGFRTSIEKMKEEGEKIPGWVEEMYDAGMTSFYQNRGEKSYFYHQGEYQEESVHPKCIHIGTLKKENKVIKKNSGASLIDLSDDIALLEFHSKNNSIGLDIIQMINHSIEEVEKNYKGLVIGNQGKNFCVGANLAMILMEAQDANYFEIDLVVRQFQKAMMNLKYCSLPVVAAPHAMTLGGGTEVCLPADAIQASSETYMGLVETGVGLIPGGGGNKEFYIREIERLSENVQYDLQKAANQVFETIAMATVSTSAAEAKEKGFLRLTDGISFNQDYLLYEAKQKALALAESGYRAPKRQKIPVVGESGYATMLMGAQSMLYSKYISEHDFKIAKQLSYVIAGGRLPFGTMVDEQYLLDLEREAFLSLVGEPLTQQRMQHMLLKGKPLRN